MSRKLKILGISVALASLAAFSRCGGDKSAVETIAIKARAVEGLSKVCDIGVPPQPPNAMFNFREACFGEVECPPELKAEVATWVYNLALWVDEAAECAHQAKDLVKD